MKKLTQKDIERFRKAFKTGIWEVLTIPEALQLLNLAEETIKRYDYWKNFQPPELPEAEAHRKARERISKMTSEELLQTFVDSGINNPDGTLTKEYGGKYTTKKVDAQKALNDVRNAIKMVQEGKIEETELVHEGPRAYSRKKKK